MTKKGERLVLITEKEDADRGPLLEMAKKMGIGEIMIPRMIVKIKQLPLMGTGKLDYVGIADFVREKLDRTNKMVFS